MHEHVISLASLMGQTTWVSGHLKHDVDAISFLPCSGLGRQVSQMNENIARSFLCYLNDFRTWNVIEHLVRESFLQEFLLSGLPGQSMRLNSRNASIEPCRFTSQGPKGVPQKIMSAFFASHVKNAATISD